MKRNVFLLIILFTLAAGFVACSATGGSEPDATGGETSDGATAANCVLPAEGTLQIIDAELGYCFLYPDNYEFLQTEDGSLTLYVDSPQNTEAPLASITAHQINGRTIQEIIPDYPSDAELAAMSFLTIDVGGETATVIDTIPGQDTNRRVFVMHGDTLYDLMFARFGPEYGAVGEAAESLYSTVTGTFRFIDG